MPKTAIILGTVGAFFNLFFAGMWAESQWGCWQMQVNFYSGAVCLGVVGGIAWFYSDWIRP